ncbi:5-dehydro-2-deoxygluconokinase [Spirochaetota bacterium]|nr:5-dehydro-2-deoxygluconokinase [Spirochaetota bacterium]
MEKKFDIISMGRAAVDIYAYEIGARLEEASGFSKYLGGSSGNIAYGCARQGLKVSMLTRVGADHMGRFVIETFNKAGVDTSAIKEDANRLTGLAFLGIKDNQNFPLLFYRKDCADMGIRSEHISEPYIASTRVLILTGTHFSKEKPRAACFQALKYAKKHNVKVVLDIDYRPVLWGLTKLDKGTTYFVSSENVSTALQEIFPYCDVIVGTEEEIHIGGNTTETIAALKTIRSHTQATLVLKRGAKGSHVFTKEIPNNLSDARLFESFNVPVLNSIGAGDAFMSGLMRGYVNNEGWEQALRYANAAGAIVVSRHGCAPAIPTRIELDDYLERSATIKRIDLDKRINRLHRVTTREHKWEQVTLLAFDHCHLLEQYLIKEYNMTPTEYTPLLKQLKFLILKGFYETTDSLALAGRAGILCDDKYGQDVLNDITGKDFLIARPSEKAPRVPLTFNYPNIGLEMSYWPKSHVIKCLIAIDGDDDEALITTQFNTLSQLYHDCSRTDHELMLEWLPRTTGKKQPETIGLIMEKTYNLGIYPDWWKLLIESKAEWNAATRKLEAYDPYCRGIVLLGAGNSIDQMTDLFKLGSKEKWARGFAVGRTIFYDAAKAWFAKKISDTECISLISRNYAKLIQAWQQFD